MIDGKLVRVVSWYDNEWGFSNRMVDTAVRDGGRSAEMGRIAGIARHDRPLGPMEVLERVELIEGQGVDGDFRGTRKAGSLGQNGVVLIEAGDWAAAPHECGASCPGLSGAATCSSRARPAAAAGRAAAHRREVLRRDHAGMRAVRADGGAASGASRRADARLARRRPGAGGQRRLGCRRRRDQGRRRHDLQDAR